MMVSSRPNSAQHFSLQETPDTHVKVPIDQDLSSLAIDGSGDYQEDLINEAENEVNSNDLQAVSNKTEEVDVAKVDAKAENVEASGTIKPNFPIDLSPNNAKTIGQLEEEMHDYFYNLLETTPTDESAPSRKKSHTESKRESSPSNPKEDQPPLEEEKSTHQPETSSTTAKSSGIVSTPFPSTKDETTTASSKNATGLDGEAGNSSESVNNECKNQTAHFSVLQNISNNSILPVLRGINSSVSTTTIKPYTTPPKTDADLQTLPSSPFQTFLTNFVNGLKQITAKKLAAKQNQSLQSNQQRFPVPRDLQAAQDQILSTIFSTFFRSMTRNSARNWSSTVRFRREASASADKYKYTVISEDLKNTTLSGKRRLVAIPARLVMKKSQRRVERPSRKDIERQMEVFNKRSAGGSKHRKSYREDFDQVM